MTTVAHAGNGVTFTWSNATDVGGSDLRTIFGQLAATLLSRDFFGVKGDHALIHRLLSVRFKTEN